MPYEQQSNSSAGTEESKTAAEAEYTRMGGRMGAQIRQLQFENFREARDNVLTTKKPEMLGKAAQLIASEPDELDSRSHEEDLSF